MAARLRVTVAGAMVALSVGACGQSYDNLVTGTFGGGKLVALNWWVGTNTSTDTINLDAYADVADQTPGTVDINGPQHWRCTGRFTTPSYVPSTGGLFQSQKDQLRDKVVKLPSMLGAFAGPPGKYRVTIEVPSRSVKFAQTWQWTFPESPLGALQLFPNGHGCTQVVDSLLLQRSLADQYLDRLESMLTKYWGFETTGPLHAQLQALLDQAKQAKISGDGRADPAARTADYKSSAAILTKMAQLARDAVPAMFPPGDIAPGTRGNIIDLATEAAALLSITGLS